MKTRLVALFCTIAAVTTVSAADAPRGIAALAPDVPAGTYSLDRTHASLLFRVDHMGFSMYTARFTDFNAQLQGEAWLNTAEYPQMIYRSTGVTRPVTLDATFNGGYPGMTMDPNARIGFSARGTLERSEFAMTYGIPEPGSRMGVGDEVEVIVEVEFSGPPWTGQPEG